jgi:hypothetical protein
VNGQERWNELTLLNEKSKTALKNLAHSANLVFSALKNFKYSVPFVFET